MTTLLFAIAAVPVAYRFQPDTAKTYDVALKVYWFAQHKSATLRMAMKFRKVSAGLYTMDIDLVGADLDGKDESATLKAALKSPRVSMDWNNLAQRSGGMTQLQIKELPQRLIPILSEAGVYLCEFPRKTVSAGEKYVGSTTASGGCTTGSYTYVGLEGSSAVFRVDNIALHAAKQVEAMRFTVDPKTGIPLSMTYQIDDPAKGGKLSFRQTIAEQR